ncbi:MAG: hemerythrin domain-containing protein [Bacteroidota bacterium]|nr:hemerythrin domain-containing protein [Bacteroidota bacterium]
MSKLINELELEHKNLLNNLNELKKIGTTSVKGKELISKTKSTILAHLEKEDKLLYPPLYKKAKTNKSIDNTLDTFATNMESITGYVSKFYKKYSDNNLMNNNDFSTDITKFIILFKERVMKEEVILFKLYDKI